MWPRKSNGLGVMQYREIGNTDIKVSVLGFGRMRLPTHGDVANVDKPASIDMLRYAIDHGINYF